MDGIFGSSSDKNYCSVKNLVAAIGKQESYCINISFRQRCCAFIITVPTECRIAGRNICPLEYFLSPAVKDREIFDPATFRASLDIEDFVVSISIRSEGIGYPYGRKYVHYHLSAGLTACCRLYIQCIYDIF